METLFNLDSKKITLKRTNVKTIKGNHNNYEEDIKIVNYDILLNGEKIGELSENKYFGSTTGKLYNKDLPDIDSYIGSGENPIDKLKRFLDSATGKKWAQNLQKYNSNKITKEQYLRKIIKEEFEQIKKDSYKEYELNNWIDLLERDWQYLRQDESITNIKNIISQLLVRANGIGKHGLSINSVLEDKNTDNKLNKK